MILRRLVFFGLHTPQPIRRFVVKKIADSPRNIRNAVHKSGIFIWQHDAAEKAVSFVKHFIINLLTILRTHGTCGTVFRLQCATVACH